MREIKWRPRANLDRQSIAIFIGIERGNPPAALRVMQEIDKALELARSFPESGRAIAIEGPTHKDYRRVLVGNYMVFYRFDESAVTVYRVLHQRHDIDAATLIDFLARRQIVF